MQHNFNIIRYFNLTPLAGSIYFTSVKYLSELESAALVPVVLAYIHQPPLSSLHPHVVSQV